MQQTPWEALKSFLREYDHKDGNYTEVTFNYATSATDLANSITLRNIFGEIAILVGNRTIDEWITRGTIKERARILNKFERYGDLIILTSPVGVFDDRVKYAKESYFELQIGYGQNKFKIKCGVSTESRSMGFKLISNMVTGIEYNREVHDVLPGNLHIREGDPDVNPDLRGVTAQGGEMRKEIKLDLEKS